ncbi:MAG: LamG domain-containing protein [Pedobacter sp.]|nr:MAG: LamG domain-containing protein [Pedobacter sp.]
MLSTFVCAVLGLIYLGSSAAFNAFTGGKIDGFSSSDEIYPNNLIAYFPFNDNTNESKSGSVPTGAPNVTLVDGYMGKAANFNAGYLYFGKQFDAFKTDALKSFTISQWIQISNNGSKKTQLFQLSRPGNINGNIDIILETNLLPATDINNLSVRTYFYTLSGGRQDNVNQSYNKSPKIGPSNWVHLLLTYNGLTGKFNIWANGVNIGSYSDRGIGNNVFNSFEPNELIIGGNYNLIPGKTVNTDVSFAPMTGKIDELRVYNIFFPDIIVQAMYKLGVAKK